MNKKSKELLTYFILFLVVIVLVWVISVNYNKNSIDQVTIKDWPWYQDEYFNIKFQYPSDWKVEKVDTTDYYNDPIDWSLLGGEDAAVAGPDIHKTWIIRIVPPYEDIQEIQRGMVGTVHSAIVIDQPNWFNGNNYFFSDVSRPKEWGYEAVLDPYGEGFRFNFTSHLAFVDRNATTSISFGHSPDGSISGVTALKLLPNGYHFQPYITMTSKLGHNEDNILVLSGVARSIQLLFPERHYDEKNYQIPILQSEYKTRK